MTCAACGALPYLARLDAAMAAQSVRTTGAGSGPTGGTTADDRLAREEAGLT